MGHERTAAQLTDTVLVGLIAAVPATVAALAALVVSLKGNRKVAAISVQIDGRLDELLATTRAAGNASGRAAGIEAERVRAERPLP